MKANDDIPPNTYHYESHSPSTTANYLPQPSFAQWAPGQRSMPSDGVPQHQNHPDYVTQNLGPTRSSLLHSTSSRPSSQHPPAHPLQSWHPHQLSHMQSIQTPLPQPQPLPSQQPSGQPLQTPGGQAQSAQNSTSRSSQRHEHRDSPVAHTTSLSVPSPSRQYQPIPHNSIPHNSIPHNPVSHNPVSHNPIPHNPIPHNPASSAPAASTMAGPMVPGSPTHVIPPVAAPSFMPSAGHLTPNVVEKHRVRVNKACDRCRTHKIKCSGNDPCSNCTKHGIPCKFRSVSSSGEPPPKKARSDGFESPVASGGATHDDNDTSDLGQSSFPPIRRPEEDYPSYTTYLENKVRYLEAVLSESSMSSIAPHHEGGKSYKLDDVVIIQRDKSTKWRVCRRYEGALAIRLCTTLFNTLPPEARALVEIPRTNYYGWNMSGCHYLKPEKLPKFPANAQLSVETKQSYIEYYFKDINPLYAILHETVFREQWKMYQMDKSDEQTTNNTSLFSAMVAIVCALGIRFNEFAKPEGPSMEILRIEELLFSYSHKVVSIFSVEWESFELIQCWLLLTLYLRVAHRQTSCHSSLGRAISMSRSMGLGNYDSVPGESPPYERLKARRIFFAVYTFDRLIGLQGGKFRGLTDTEINREFPSMNFDAESSNDDWITRPALAMIHIARLANYLEISDSSESDLVIADKINKDLENMQKWLDNNGFNDERDIFAPKTSGEIVSSVVLAQVKLHFYELVSCVNGKSLFERFGHQTAIHGFKYSVVMDTNQRIIYLIQKIQESGYLLLPWYITLQLLLIVGVTSLVFINMTMYVAESNRTLSQTMRILQFLQNSPVRDKSGKLVVKQRFKMVEECIWLLKMISHMMTLSYEEALKGLNKVGIDHGPSDINKNQFQQFAMRNQGHEGSLDKLMEDQNRRHLTKDESISSQNSHSEDRTQGSPDSFPSTSHAQEQFVGNLAWFDQWLDFYHDL